MSVMVDFLSGATAMGFLIAGLFFFRFWRRTGDILFAIFGIAFALLAFHQLLFVLLAMPREEQSWAYSLRLVAFGLIIAAVVRKNMAGGHDRD